MLYSLAERCTVTSAIAHNLAADLAAQQIYVIPSVTNPSVTEMSIMRHAIALLNSWQLRPTGVVDAMLNMVKGYLWSKTGVFIAMPRDGNVVQSLLVLPSMIVFPHYGWMGDGTVVVRGGGSLIAPGEGQIDKWGNPIGSTDEVQGIYYTDVGVSTARYYELAREEYYQICPGALGYGAFQTTKPRAEGLISDIVEMIALDDYARGVMLNTDESQVVLWQNVSSTQLKEFSEKRKQMRELRRKAQPIPPDEQGLRLHATAKDPTRPANVIVADLRALPKDFDLVKLRQDRAEALCVRSGVHPRRATPNYQSERFGNSTVANTQQHDEPAEREIKITLEAFVTSVLMGGTRARAAMVAENSPENYAIVQRDVSIAQALSQSDWMSPEMKMSYALRQGMIQPSEAGTQAFRTGDSEPGETISLKSFATLVDRQGRPYVWEPPIVVQPSLNGRKAFDVEECTRLATGRYEEWIENELPTVVQGNRLDRSVLTEEVDDIANDVWSQVVRCYRSQTGNDQSPQVREILNYNRAAWLNAIASPEARPPVPTERRPGNNLWLNIWSQAGRIALGDATTDTLKATAAFFTPYIARYMNAIRAGVSATEWQGREGPVRWSRHALDSCGDCVAFEGVYPSYAAMLRRTRGLVPGDLRLTCSGNCKCDLAAV